MVYADFLATDLDTLCRAAGLLGFAIYVTAFFLLSIGKLDSKRPAYFAMVFVASSCVMASLMTEFNLAAALIQGFYIAMSFGGLLLRRGSLALVRA